MRFTVLLLLAVVACKGPAPQQVDASVVISDATSAIDADPGCTADVANTYYQDIDGDGYGGEVTAVDCTPPVGFVANNLDCDDRDSRNNPEGAELCDGLDNDCNADTLETCPAPCTVQTNGSDIYLYCDQTTNHANAATICQAEGMHLVHIDSAEEQTFVANQRLVAFGGRTPTWIGATDTATENVWLWSDGTQFWQGRENGVAVDGRYERWAGGEPNDDGTEDCAQLRNSDSTVGTWNDVPCGVNQRYICERDTESY